MLSAATIDKKKKKMSSVSLLFKQGHFSRIIWVGTHHVGGHILHAFHTGSINKYKEVETYLEQ